MNHKFYNNMTTEEFINKAKNVHGDKYDYSSTEYTSSTAKVCIICPKHGNFYQLPNVHLENHGCPICGKEEKAKRNKWNKETFDKFLQGKYNGKYKVVTEFLGLNKNIEIECQDHGNFITTPQNIINGKICSQCKKEKKFLELTEKANKLYNNKYKYCIDSFTNSTTKTKIICPIHGEFFMDMHTHLKGQGCPKCGVEKRSKTKTSNTGEFVIKAGIIHNSLYSYDNVEYIGYKDKIKITCPIHGDFEQTPNAHLSGCGCPKCNSNSISNGEKEIYEYIKNLLPNETIIQRDRNTISPQELDIYIPSKKIAIEYDGLYWHSEIYIDKNYHLNKTTECEKQNIQLIHIFEDEWINKNNIVKSRLKSLLGLSDNIIYARKCKAKEITNKEGKKFIENNHIQGNTTASKYYGLYFNDKLVSVMSFGKLRINLGQKNRNNDVYELIRFCNKLNTNVIGGASKLLKYFITIEKPKEIISYADRRWSVGNLYEKMRFVMDHTSNPNYFYVIDNVRKNRFNFRKDILIKKYGCKKEETEHEFCLKKGWNRIYDCGTKVYKLKLE